MLNNFKRYLFLWITFIIQLNCLSQLRITQLSGSALNVNFGQGTTNPGLPFSGGTDFQFTQNVCPTPGYYTLVNKTACPNRVSLKNDAGQLFVGSHPVESDSGYMMLVSYEANGPSKNIFFDTLHNLCRHTPYLFCAALINLGHSTGCYPNLTFSVETLSGHVIQTSNTGNIGSATDNGAAYFGYSAPDKKSTFPYYYGGIFNLPATTTDIVVKIVTNSSFTSCINTFAIDNIVVTAVGPQDTIAINGDKDIWVTSTCFESNKPVVLTTNTGSGYLNFGDSDFINVTFANPAYQWQQSVGNQYSWIDIPGETSPNLSHIFSNPDTFYLRLRSSEAANIHNANCSVVSNVVQVQVDDVPSDFGISSNSPVCTDSDIVLSAHGGASYLTTGPNGFTDNSPFPHIYHPQLANSGWYTAKIITAGGCIVSDSTFVQVIGPDIKLSVSDSVLCYGQRTQLHGSGGTRYTWSPATGLSDANIANPFAAPLATTRYQLRVTDGSGCSAFGTVIVRLRNGILKAAAIAPLVLCPNDIAVFKDTSIGKIIGWYWDFANGQTSHEQSPLPQRFPVQQQDVDYVVKLTVTDSTGCTNTTSAIVKAINNCYITVPTAFTPNNDGLNDYLYPLNAYKATNLRFRVYDRFGQVVFETRDWTHKWDGTIKSIPQSLGIYVWTLEYTNEGNRRVFLKGTTVLIR